jgi:DNA adenine methylase
LKNLKAKPILKWAGGKSQLLPFFEQLYPLELKTGEIKNYYEPFLGSGAVFFWVAQNYDVDNFYLYDLNDDLIIAYRVVQKDVSRLIEVLQCYDASYRRLGDFERKEFFYNERVIYNSKRFKADSLYSEEWIKRAASFIFLNRTCYNGLYRLNSKGEFNTPAGEYRNPEICNRDNLLAVSELLKRAIIKRADFTAVLEDLKSSAFIYFDPPYRPISKTSNFKSYYNNDFSDKDQEKLADLFKELDRCGARVMLSNSDPKNMDPHDDFFDKLYGDFNILRVCAKRSINSKKEGRGYINEIVVMNYS